MINEERQYASLSSGLLARKGTAKPAMRPQGLGGFEDLGWNDMGHTDEFEAPLPEHVPSSIAALTPAPKLKSDEPSVVAQQQRAIAESFEEQAEDDQAADEAGWTGDDYQDGIEAEAEAEAETEFEAEAEAEVPAPQAPRPVAQAKVVALPKRPAVAASGRKAAFTLRLDEARHLRLRLSTAVTGCSAQQIVTHALDQYLASFPEIDALAERIPASGNKRS